MSIDHHELDYFRLPNVTASPLTPLLQDLQRTLAGLRWQSPVSLRWPLVSAGRADAAMHCPPPGR